MRWWFQQAAALGYEGELFQLKRRAGGLRGLRGPEAKKLVAAFFVPSELHVFVSGIRLRSLGGAWEELVSLLMDRLLACVDRLSCLCFKPNRALKFRVSEAAAGLC